MKISLEVRLTSDDSRFIKVLSRNLDNYQSMINIINNGDKDKQLLILKGLKDSDVDFLLARNYELASIDFIVTQQDLLEFIKKSTYKGVSHNDIQNNWPHVKPANWPITKLQYSEIMTGHGPNKPYENYILREYQEQNREYYTRSKNPIIDKSADTPKKDHDIPKTQVAPRKALSTSQCRACRKSIIKKAQKSDIFIGGLKPDFIKSLTEDEQAYIASLDSFKIKLIVSEVSKKPAL